MKDITVGFQDVKTYKKRKNKKGHRDNSRVQSARTSHNIQE